MTARKACVSMVLACLAGCDSASPTTPAAPATFTQVYEAMFPVHSKGQCNFCHSLPPNQKSNGMLSMGEDRATAYAALVKKPSASAGCKAQVLVVPGKPAESLFLAKLEPSPGCGDRMPLGGSVLTSAQLEMVRSWIAAGALDN